MLARIRPLYFPSILATPMEGAIACWTAYHSTNCARSSPPSTKAAFRRRRKLLRAQSVISETVSNLEDQIGVELFDRTGRYPADGGGRDTARRCTQHHHGRCRPLKARAKGWPSGSSPNCPLSSTFSIRSTPLPGLRRSFGSNIQCAAASIYVVPLGAAIQPVLDGRCSAFVIGSLAPVIFDTLTNERLPGISFLMVARVNTRSLPCGKIVLSPSTQIVLTDRSNLSAGRELGVMSPTTCALADLFAKHHHFLPSMAWLGRYAFACGTKRFQIAGASRPVHRGRSARWLTALQCLRCGDLVAAGSCRQMVH